jgi:hypothetical protein
MERERFRARLHRWLWFTGLYVAGVGTLAVVAYGIRALLRVLAHAGQSAH